MDSLLSSRSIGISDLREAPAKAFADAKDEAVVVLNHNRPAGYIVSTRLMAHILDQLADRAITEKARQRASTVQKSRKISLNDL